MLATPTGDIAEMEEIAPGSAPIEIGRIIGVAIEFTKRHFGMILAVGAIYLGISLGIGMVQGLIEGLLGVEPFAERFAKIEGEPTPQDFLNNPRDLAIQFFLNLITQVFTLFLSLGVTRIGLNIVSGKHFEIGTMFGEGDKLLRIIGAGILYGLMVVLGLLLFIVPGIYLAIRFGQYQFAIVDRNLGVMDAFRYSSQLTLNNKWRLVGLFFVSMAIYLAGMLALCVGLIFAYPVIWLAGFLAYRWMQYGEAACRPADAIPARA